jgi:hypothetical protein
VSAKADTELAAMGRLGMEDGLAVCADGHIGPDKPHQYDHYLGYSAEHHTDVQAVCIDCHTARDSQKKKQSHCKRGHEFTPENTRISNGTRHCRECGRQRMREQRVAAKKNSENVGGQRSG